MSAPHCMQLPALRRWGHNFPPHTSSRALVPDTDPCYPCFPPHTRHVYTHTSTHPYTRVQIWSLHIREGSPVLAHHVRSISGEHRGRWLGRALREVLIALANAWILFSLLIGCASVGAPSCFICGRVWGLVEA
jgi:hypothetical protein